MKVLFLDIDGVVNGGLRNEELSWHNSEMLIRENEFPEEDRHPTARLYCRLRHCDFE